MIDMILLKKTVHKTNKRSNCGLGIEIEYLNLKKSETTNDHAGFELGLYGSQTRHFNHFAME